MKSVRSSVYLLMMLLAILAACAPQATPVATDTPTVEAAPPASASDTPTAAAGAPTEAGSTDTPTPAPLFGPPMEVGSKIVYFDLSTLIAVPIKGPNLMGHGATDNPVHEVTVSDFWIYQAKVTNRQYALCEAAGQCLPPDPCTEPTCAGGNRVYRDPFRSNDPVVAVDWARAEAYCTWVGGRLPTEAEWEKAAAWDEAKKEHRIYPWGSAAPSCDHENFGLCKGTTTDVTTHPLGISFYEGLDFSGNAYEWVADWYKSTYYGESPAEDPQGPAEGTKRSIRSTAFNAPGYSTEAAARYRDDPKAHRNDLGFRCVVEDPTQFAPLCETLSLYGSAPGGGPAGGIPSPVCPSVSITQAELECNNMVSTTNVTFNSSDPAAVVDHGTCATNVDPAPVPEKWNCSAATNVSITANCTWSDPGPASCAANYTLIGDTCVWTGGGAINPECPDGYDYDPDHQCCSVTPGSALDYPLCPPGYSPVQNPPGVYKCYSGDDPGIAQQNDVVHIKTCGGPGDHGGCDKNANSCQYGFDAANCCCLYVDPGCYAP